MFFNKAQVPVRKNDDDDDHDDTNDPTAPFYELEAFDSIWQGLRWKQIRTRVPVCFRKTIRNRYMLANLVYLGYAIGILIIDFNPTVNGSSSSSASINDSDFSNFSSFSNFTDENDTTTTTTTMLPTTTSTSILEGPVYSTTLVNHLYLGFAVVHLVSAFLYWWAWAGRSWLDVIMIPEYLNHIEAALYIWSATWYPKEVTLGDYYTLGVHKIEMTAATVELVASVGWIMSWYLTYIRTLGHGFSMDDPDTIAFTSTTIASIIYFVYNIQINVDPGQYGTNYLYTNADILYFVAACYYIFAALRDDHWFWFLPFAGQYGVAPGRVKIETTKVLPKAGKPAILMTDPCTRRRTNNDKAKRSQRNSDKPSSIITIAL